MEIAVSRRYKGEDANKLADSNLQYDWRIVFKTSKRQQITYPQSVVWVHDEVPANVVKHDCVFLTPL